MKAQKNTILAIILGIISALFLSSTFTINSLLAHSGGHWAWTACLRSLFMIPVMLIPLLATKRFKAFWCALKSYPILFFKWGTIGFGGLYTCMALASLLIPGWLVAATFQLNILAGILLAPFLYEDHRKKIPIKALGLSLFIVSGVLIMQLDKLSQLHDVRSLAISFFLVLIGAIVWPLANRKLLLELDNQKVPLNAMQRVLGLTAGSLPLWLLLAGYAFTQVGMAPDTQLQASFYSAVFSGFLGGVGFYKATQMVKQDSLALATVEATQVFEIFFTLIGEMWLINAPLPKFYGFAGMLMIISGMLVQITLSVQYAKRSNLQST
ncbi:multidrug resistance efflux transporter family protein [Olivibacter sp. XZL3]|uniref:DMT family transporter n=1 Tax=Olivibacter sp. XZL3 TaxID=1735116 RepID=UPI0010653F89|nr:multidrug resistance efflux transporter family protein [Olivibacter sp. XZL3]